MPTAAAEKSVAPANPRQRLDGKTIVLLVVIFAGVTVLWNTPVVFPLRILVVFFHELSHGLAALVTGGSIQSIQLTSDEAGLATTLGGWPFVIASAGYLGSLVFGSLILVLAARTRLDRWITAALGVVLIGVSILFVPIANTFGFLFGLVGGVVLLAVAKWLPNSVSDILLKVVGITSCGYVVLDIYSDLLARDIPASDANALARLTGIPGAVWGGIWIVLAVAGAVFALWLSARGERPAAAPASAEARRP